MFPVPAFKLRFCVPLIVLEKEIFPLERLVLKVDVPIKLSGVLYVMPPVSVMTLPWKFRIPGPLRVVIREPTRMGLGLPPVIDPVTVAIKGPPFVAVNAPPLKILFTSKKIPAAVFVLRSPLNVMVPPVSVIETDAALRAATVKFVQLWTVKIPIRVVPPMAAVATTFPVPAVIVKFWAPSTVLLNVISPAPAPEFKTNAPLNVIGPEKEIGWLLVVIVPL